MRGAETRRSVKNIHTLNPSIRLKLLPTLAGIVALMSSVGLYAAVTVSSNVTFNSGIYTYSYTVTNAGTTFDLATVDFPVGEGVSVTNLIAPPGFGAIFDGSPINLVSLFEDNDPVTPQTFAPNSTSAAFRYDSVFGPGVVTFSAIDANGDTFTGTAQSAVPESSSLMLLGTVAIPLLAIRRRPANH